jgi:L-arabinose isomerase
MATENLVYDEQNANKQEVIVGHWQDEEILKSIDVWARAACGWHDWQQANSAAL